MRRQFLAALIVALFFSGWYYYHEAHPCIVPLPYALGSIDERFGINTETAQRLAEEATAVWESALGRQLFTYTENANFKIDFVYDERQARSESAEAVKAALDQKENASKSINEEYERLLAEYNKIKESYEAKVASYNGRLETFNRTVDRYNQSGGAPQAEYETLQKTERGLKAEEATLATEAKNLTTLASNLNAVSEEGNNIISEYNEGVVQYNQTYTGGEEFTQGEYNGTSIEIYHFKDQTELRNVLIHEFGHAIGLPHVEGRQSIMYYLMDEQPATSELSNNDLAALSRVCKPNDDSSTRFHHLFSSLFSKLHLI
jgi:hypothetical protein